MRSILQFSSVKYTVYILFWVMLLPGAAYSGGVKKALKRVNAGWYEQAQPVLEKCLKKRPDDFVVHYIAAKYFYLPDNPAADVDSAHHHLGLAVMYYDSTAKDKRKKKFSKWSVRPLSMELLQNGIYRRAYHIADSLQTVDGFEHFISYYPDAPQRDTAITQRNQLAYKEALSDFTYKSFKEFMEKYPNASQLPEAKKLYESLLYKNVTKAGTWQAYKQYMQQYPEGEYVDEARENYHRLFFKEKTSDGNIGSFSTFANNYPDSPYARQAEDSVYAMSIKKGKYAEYAFFIRNYPKNHNVNNAWKQLYDLFCLHRTVDELTSFKDQFPDFPFKKQLENDLAQASMQLKLEQNSKGFFGYKKAGADSLQRFPYTDAYPFSENLAAITTQDCSQQCAYGYINKFQQVVIPMQFDEALSFSEGRAAVSKCSPDACQWGFIDRNGDKVVPLQYDEVFAYQNGYALVGLDDRGYGFVDRNGHYLLPPAYPDARSFSDWLAAVQRDSLWGFINTDGKWAIKPAFANARSFSEGLAPVQAADTLLWGYINRKGQWAIQPQFSYALEFKNDTAKVIVEEMKYGSPVKTEKLISKEEMLAEP